MFSHVRRIAGGFRSGGRQKHDTKVIPALVNVRLPILIIALGARLASASSASVTFHKDVEPILQNHCQSCHRPGEAAPMSLLTYEQTRPWAKAIRAAILTGKMPPWHPNPQVGKFSNDLSLPAGDRATLVAWIDSGASEGDPAQAPPPRAFLNGWQIPEPDIVFEMPGPFDVPASGVIDYQYLSVPTHFTEDKWVQMAEVRPGERSVVHHAIVVVDSHDGSEEQYLAGYAPGMAPQIWKPGQARLIKAGSTLIFQMHYTTNGKRMRDRSRIGLIFAKQPTTEKIIGLQAAAPALAIPPGDPNY